MSPRTAAAPLPGDLEAGLKRLKLSTIRRQAPEVLLTARTQRWTPEETLRVLVGLEIASRDESNCRARMTAARFPVVETPTPSISLSPRSRRPATTISSRWTGSAEPTTCAWSGPPGPARATTSSGWADPPSKPGTRCATSPPSRWSSTSGGPSPTTPSGGPFEQVCRNELILIDEIGFAPLDHTGCQLMFRLIAAAYERRSVAIASHSPFESWGRFLSSPDHHPPVSYRSSLTSNNTEVLTSVSRDSYS